jgi:pimeloyl-ACP methyl ester carboxylesterase
MGEENRGDYASVNSLNLYYEVHGDGQPLILLHGASAPSRCSERSCRCSRRDGG